MKWFKRSVIYSAIILILVCSCRKKTPPSALEHKRWIESLNDTIAMTQKEMEDINAEIQSTLPEIERKISNFKFVDNPKAVEGYYILSSWSGKYPLTSTGIIARLTENEELEISAALSKGRFTHISLSSGNDQYVSPEVSHDQAFNYLTDSFDRVCFAGSAADSIALFIQNHKADKISIKFIEEKISGNATVSESEKNMIVETLDLYQTRKKLKELEKTNSLLAGKINSCRQIMAGQGTIDSQTGSGQNDITQ